AGVPFQVETVRITSGNRTAGAYTIEWTVWGDESRIDHYEVGLVQVRPGHGNPLDGASYTLAADVPRGVHSWTSWVETGLSGPHLFLAPWVVAVPAAPASTPGHSRWGPARTIYPAGPIASQPKLHPVYWYRRPAPPTGI